MSANRPCLTAWWQRRAIVHARPGVTRDRLEAVAKLLGGDVIIT
jgi:predicted GTPase